MKRMPVLRHASRGVSLIEALVALAVMAIGLLGVVGMQASLRSSADNSKQRSEAVRLAQEKIEDLRAFGELELPSASTLHDYTKIVTELTPSTVVSSTTAGFSNATFAREVTVNSPTADQPRLKTVRVEVSWNDRLSSTDKRSVELFTTIAESSPELGASLGLPANLAGPQSPSGRNLAIPRSAVRGTGASSGTSVFRPPGGGGARWTFKNDSGLISQICSPSGTCTGGLAALLSGYVRFATDTVQPTPADAEMPPSSDQPVEVEVLLTYPMTITVSCYTSTPRGGYRLYYCAVPLIAVVPVGVVTYTWSGRPSIVPSTLAIASSVADASSTRYRVCRYTPEPSDTPTGGNPAHPLDYADVGTSLNNQNFLVIRAGDDTTPYTCPNDNTSTPLVNGQTYRHQPVI